MLSPNWKVRTERRPARLVLQRRACREMYETVAAKDCLEFTATGHAGFDRLVAGQITASTDKQ
jgi:hypothetical protein